MGDLRAVHVHFAGIVQGVGFRAYVQAHCSKVGVVGWVRNCSDGTVQAELIGQSEVLAETIRAIHRGRAHQISSVITSEAPMPVEPGAKFEILP